MILFLLLTFMTLSATDPEMGYLSDLRKAERIKKDEEKVVEPVKDLSLIEELVVEVKKPEEVKKSKSVIVPSEIKKILSAQYERSELLNKEVSLTLKSASIEDAIELVGKSAELNFVIDSSVRGTVKNINLKDIPVAFALKALFSNNNPELALKREFGIYRVLSLEKAIKDLKERADDIGRNEYEKGVFTLQNIDLDENLKLRVKNLWSGVTGNESDDTYLVFDNESKKLFFKGRGRDVEDLREYLREIDIKAPQVKIEARVIIAKKDFDETFGLQLSGIYNRRASMNSGVGFIGSGPLGDVKNNPVEQGAGLMDWALNFLPDTSKRNLHIPFIFGGSDLNTKRLNLVLSAAENRGELKTILKPSILTNHGEESEILVGDSVPIQTIVKESIEGTLRDVTTASYKEVGTKLKVKPLVSPDKKTILLDIFVENSSHSKQGKFPLITSARTKSRVRLRNGQTTMIGGLIENSKSKNKSSVPLIGEIPLIGRLFKGSYKEEKDHQLLIFITPRVVNS